ARRRGQELAAMLPALSTHHNSLGADLMHLAILHLLLWEGSTAREHAEDLRTLANETDMLLWLGMATMMRGAAVVEEGCLSHGREQIEEGIAQLRQGVAAYRATGAGLDFPHCLALLARGYQETEQVADGLVVTTEAMETVNDCGERYYEAELYRLKGTLTLQQFHVSRSTFHVDNAQCAMRNWKRRRKPKRTFSGPSTLLAANRRSCWNYAQRWT